jgi:hypothetical protein
VIRQPQHPVKPAFDKARDWAAQQEQLLTEAQRRVYEGIKNRQERERRQQEEKIALMKDQLRELAKNQKLTPELALNPPYRARDPYVRMLARKIIKAEKYVHDLERNHEGERAKALKDFARERTKDDKKQELDSSWHKAVVKAAQQEAARDRDREHDIDLTDTFGKVR